MTNAFADFVCNTQQPDRDRRVRIRAENATRPRCALCEADFLIGAAGAGLEIENGNDGAFVAGDLVCFWCWDGFNREPSDDSSSYQYGRA
jgi:hypothetical protein